jgi:hypothetical protein
MPSLAPEDRRTPVQPPDQSIHKNNVCLTDPFSLPRDHEINVATCFSPVFLIHMSPASFSDRCAPNKLQLTIAKPIVHMEMASTDALRQILTGHSGL